MTALYTHHRKQMQDLARLNAKVASIAEEIEDDFRMSTPKQETDSVVMREVESSKFKRVNAARYGG